MNTICARVNPRLLKKADRLFTGSLGGRMIELLQNARRAGATHVHITNHEGVVTVHDNGRGIDDFSKLLDLGNSGWDESLESSEDPAGVGLFCLAPREVRIRSNGKMLTITEAGWTGEPVDVLDDPEPTAGTLLRFQDEVWTFEQVERHAVYSGLQVTVDDQACSQVSFVRHHASHHPELGCRIEVREHAQLEPWHHSLQRTRRYDSNVLVNFHGQVVPFGHQPVSEHELHYLVDLTGEPTGIRLMLPARTCLVENEAFATLKNALEYEAYRYLLQRGHHRLPYCEYLRAKELGIELSEATPTFRVGLLTGDSPAPIEIVMPEDFTTAQCYRMENNDSLKDGDESNVHLLAALGKFTEPFMPLDISSRYDGYSWAKIPTIQKVDLERGDILEESYLWGGQISCVESIRITAHCSDGKVFSSPVCMAVDPPEDDNWEEHVLVTRDFREHVNSSEVWYHLGGWSDDGDTYDTQLSDFEDQLHQFWLKLMGPEESLRVQIVEAMAVIGNWQEVLVSSEGTVLIEFQDGKAKLLQPAETKGGDDQCSVPPAESESPEDKSV